MQPEELFCDIPASEAAPAHRLGYYYWKTPNAKQTVVCVHGLTRNARDFDFLAQMLSQKYNVIAPNMAGRGNSEYLKNHAAYHYGTYVQDMLVLMAQLKLTRIHWVGTSMGGVIGMMLSNTMPGLLKSLVVNDIGCFIPASGLQRIIDYAGRNIEFSTRKEAENILRNNCQTFGITNEEHWQHLFTHGITEENGGFRLSYDPKIMSSLIATNKAEDINLWGLWEGISKLPMLLLRGVESDILTQEIAAEMQQKHPRLALHQFQNTGHAPALMDDMQIRLIHNWLGKFG